MAQTGTPYQEMSKTEGSTAVPGPVAQPVQQQQPQLAVRVQQPQLAVQQQQPQLAVQVQQPVSRPDVDRRKKYKNVLYGLGVTEAIMGSICVLFGLVAIIIAAEHESDRYDYSRRYYHGFTYASQGIWCGIFLIVTGVFGFKAKRNPSVGMYNANMALSIISANLMIPLMTLSGIAAAIEASNNRYRYELASLVALHSILTIIGFVAGIICIVHSAYCCAGVCCGQHRYGRAMAFPAQPYGQQQLAMLPNGQYVNVQMQPYPGQAYPVANVQIAGPPVAQVVVPPTVMQPQGQVAPPVQWPQGQPAPPPYNGQPVVYPHDTQAMAPQPMAYPHQAMPQQGPASVGPTLPPYPTA